LGEVGNDIATNDVQIHTDGQVGNICVYGSEQRLVSIPVCRLLVTAIVTRARSNIQTYRHANKNTQ
jgi:hypothetical protein